MGSSADWERERFTMDEGCSKAVEEVFLKLYEKGYIYRGSRIINWCPVCQTSISDAEVEHEEQAGHFWHIKYPVVGEEGQFVEIATTRPETMLGDTAVAVNPNDARYTHLIGKMLKLPLTDREIPVVADEYVDQEFGTGCVKITPAHDPNDFEVGKRHDLEEINVMNDDATINERGGKYAGMSRYDARKAIVADLKEQGLLVKVTEHVHNVGTHDRCKDDGGTDDQAAVVCANERDGEGSDRGTGYGSTEFLFRNVLTRSTCIGWKISATGASQDSSGGDIGSLRITVISAVKWWLTGRPRTGVQNAAVHILHRMRIHWIPGFLPHCGPFSTPAGRSRHRNLSTFILRMCWLLGMISFSSGLSAWYSRVWNRRGNHRLIMC